MQLPQLPNSSWAILLAVLAVAWPGRLDGRPAVTDQDVDRAIERGVRYILSKQRDDGTWVSPYYDRVHPGGMTALATWTLLTARTSLTDRKLVRLDDPRLAAAIEHLKRREDMETVYARSLRLMVWCSLDPDKYRQWRNHDAAWLIRKQHRSGGWGYPGSPARRDNPSWVDTSNTQFAMLALGEAAELGSPVRPATWLRAERFWLQMQNDDGGWGYVSAPLAEQMLPAADRWRLRSYGSMTAAGLASLYIIYDNLHRGEEGRYDGRGTPRCGQPGPKSRPIRQAIQRALQWLADNFQPYPIPGDRGKISAGWAGYYHYSVERVGRTCGRKYFGPHDWYRQIATTLVTNQRPDGSWGSLDQTCFAVICLVKGRAPVSFNKLQYAGDWNDYPRDVANLTRWMSRSFETHMTWQVVDLSESAADILDAPVLYISGRIGPEFDSRAGQTIIDYVWSGGTVVAEACNGQPSFIERVRRQFRQMFPRLREHPLGPDHPIWSANFKLTRRVPILGYSDACRTRLLLIQRDIAGAWQQRLTRNYLPHFQLGANLYLYATDRQPIRSRLRPVFARQPARFERAVTVGRVRHGGKWWWSSPKAMQHLCDALARTCQIGVVERSPVLLERDELSKYRLLWMTGHDAPSLSSEQQAALRDYLRAGGVLFADAHCGSTTFDSGFVALMRAIFESTRLAELSPTSPLITGRLPGISGYDLSRLDYSRAARARFGSAGRARLLSIMIQGRPAVIYSPLDVTGGLSGEPIYGRIGYSPESARKIAVNVVLYAISRRPTTTSAPATATAPSQP